MYLLWFLSLVDDRTEARLLNKKWVGLKLREFREKRFRTAQELQEATGLTGVNQVETGKSFPRWETLVKVVKGCESTLTAFFAGLEPDPSSSGDTVSIAVKKTHKDLHRKLEEILTGDDRDAADWITGNLTVFHRDHVRKRRDR